MRSRFLWPVRVLLALFIAAWIAVIFGFSAQNGAQSSGLSESIALRLVTRLHLFDPANAKALDTVNLIVRKLAHMAEYAVLAGLAGLLLLTWPLPARVSRLAPLGFAAVCAALDEWSQTFTPGRNGTPVDVLIDAAGALIGCLALLACAHIVRTLRSRMCMRAEPE